MTDSLPAKPSLENLRKQAKTLQRAWEAAVPETLARLRSAHPKYTGLQDEQLRTIKPRLTDCQLVLAREAGFDTWRQLRVAIDAAKLELADEFIELGCLCYDDPHFDHRSFQAHARELLRQSPSLVEANIWAAATAGDTRAVRTFLDREPDIVNRHGPRGWTPLFCACYSRVNPTFETAKLLLDRGADPNTYTMKGNADLRLDQAPRSFTALAGVWGGGSTGLANQPPHPQWRELAELLLERGANPADEEALAINQDASLEILLRHGLKPDAFAASGISLMGRALSQAARHGNADQARLLLAHHARTDERFNGRLPWDHAMRLGRIEIAHLLQQAGAPTEQMDEIGQLVAHCMAGDAQATRVMLDRTPDLLARAPKDMVSRAVWTKRKEAVELVLNLGFDPNWLEDNAAIHQSGVLAEHEEILQLLLNHGASLKLRDPWYDATAIGAADFANAMALRDRLLNETDICLFDALDYGRLDRVPDILARDPDALERPFARNLSREPQPDDWQTPLARMTARGNADAVRVLLNHGANTAVVPAAGRVD